MTLQQQVKHMRDATLARLPQSIIQTFKAGIKEIQTKEFKLNALQVGEIVPNAHLKDNHGNLHELEDFYTSKFLILNFYRGGWCPYCNMELREYERLKTEFKAIDAVIVAISAENPKLAAQTTTKNTITYPILTDVNAAFMKKIGLVFQLSELAKKDYEYFGLNLSQIHENDNYELPVPAVYVVDKNRKIIFSHFEADYMTRLEPATLLQFLKTK